MREQYELFVFEEVFDNKDHPTVQELKWYDKKHRKGLPMMTERQRIDSLIEQQIRKNINYYAKILNNEISQQ